MDDIAKRVLAAFRDTAAATREQGLAVEALLVAYENLRASVYPGQQRIEEARRWLAAHDVAPKRVRIDSKLRRIGDGWDLDLVKTTAKGRTWETVHITDDGNPPPPWLLAAPGEP